MVESSSRAAARSPEQGGFFLPPGFRFHPTDEEVITSYLLQKFLNPSFTSRAMGEVDLNRCEPWDLPSKAKMGEKEWYFFCHKDMKYPTGMRTNRATREGYWKATGKDREIFSFTTNKAAAAGELVGMKKTLVFYLGRAPRGSKTNWVMHEFRIDGKSRNQTVNPKDEWVVCKVFHKKGEPNKTTNAAVEYSSAGTTPNISSVDAGEGDDDFLDSISIIDPIYFSNSDSSCLSLPAKTTAMNAAPPPPPPPPYNADYPILPTGSFVQLPNYSLTNVDTQVAVANSAPASSGSDSSSWTMLPAVHGMAMAGSYSARLHQAQHEALMVKDLGGVIGPRFNALSSSKGLPTSAVAAGVPQQNRPGSYGEYPYGNYLAGAGATINGIGRPAAAAAKNLGGRILHY